MANHQMPVILQPAMGSIAVAHQPQAQMQRLQPATEGLHIGVNALVNSWPVGAAGCWLLASIFQPQRHRRAQGDHIQGGGEQGAHHRFGERHIRCAQQHIQQGRHRAEHPPQHQGLIRIVLAHHQHPHQRQQRCNRQQQPQGAMEIEQRHTRGDRHRLRPPDGGGSPLPPRSRRSCSTAAGRGWPG